jgi:hypothetical protein
MTDFTISITDQAQLDGITWAREQHNAALPTDDAGEPVGALADDADFIEFVMQGAADSYARQQYDAAWRDAYEAGKSTSRMPPAPVVEEEAEHAG